VDATSPDPSASATPPVRAGEHGSLDRDDLLRRTAQLEEMLARTHERAATMYETWLEQREDSARAALRATEEGAGRAEGVAGRCVAMVPTGWRPLSDATTPIRAVVRLRTPGHAGRARLPPGGSALRHEGKTVLHQWCIADRADVAVVRCTAVWLREDPERARRAGLACDEDVAALAVLLDLLAAQLPYLDAAVRREVVEGCRAALG
jgi:hypothetical protein